MAKITSETGEYIHCKLGVELGKKFHEYYNHINGETLGANNFSWSAALYLDLKLNN